MRRMVGIAMAASLAVGSHAMADDGDITVMTYNQYLGASFTELAVAQDAEQFNEILVGTLRQIAATKVPERLQRQAVQIARHLPDLVGLQEVWTLDCQGPACGHPAIADAFADHLDLTLDALSELEVGYDDVAAVRNLDVTLPFVIDNLPAILQVTDHDVILKRSETVSYAEPVIFPGCNVSLEGCNYQGSLPVALPGGMVVDFLRGFVAVDVTVRGTDYLFVNTHLEIEDPPVPAIIQSLQALELIQWLEFLQPDVFAPIIVVGDINSSPEDGPELVPPFGPPYQQFVGADYVDVWTLRPGAAPGYTCCQAEDLRNQRSTLDERIDMIFSSDLPSRVRQVRLVGDRVSDKTRPPGRGLWPSDHAGVVATLRFE